MYFKWNVPSKRKKEKRWWGGGDVTLGFLEGITKTFTGKQAQS